MNPNPKSRAASGTVVLHALALALVVGLAVSLIVADISRRRLANVHEDLQKQTQRLASLTVENQHLLTLLAQAPERPALSPAQLNELLRLRGEATVNRQQQSALLEVRHADSQVHSNLDSFRQKSLATKATADFWPQDSWANAGNATPEAALKTVLWAGGNGDVTNFLAVATGQLQDMIMADVKRDSAYEVAAKLAEETYNLKSVKVLNRTTKSDGSVRFDVELETGERMATTSMVLQPGDGGWRLASTHDQPPPQPETKQ